MNIEDIDLAIVPGIAFDEQCNRLGYGKGFYDKLFNKLAKRLNSQRSAVSGRIIALAYEEQIVESIPADSHDIKMDKIITDKRIIDCHG